ncbi:hypothetical protein JS82_06095 [Methanomassiliicoccaceae archaeon DOK]|nr:hypothetical protein JS82_06095 [Methanomassiliicoccaceae archaeon DOK]
MYDSAPDYDKDTGEITVTKDTKITLTKDVGAPGQGVDVYFVLSPNVTLEITGKHSVYVTNDVTGSNGFVASMASSPSSAEEIATVSITGGADVHFATNKDTASSGNAHVFNGVNVSVTGGSKLTMSQNGYAGGVAYYDAYRTFSPTLTVTGSKVILDHAGGINAKLDVTKNSTISIQNPKAGAGYITLNAGSAVTDSTIDVTNSSDSQMGVQVQPKIASDAVSITKSNVTVTGEGIFQLANGAELNASESTITAPTINIRGTDATLSATISGGTLNGNITGDGKTANNLKLTGVTLDEATLSDDVTMDESSTVTTTGNSVVTSFKQLQTMLKNENATVIASGNIKVNETFTIKADQEVTFQNATVTYTGDNVEIIVKGALNTDNSYLYIPVDVDEDAVVTTSNTHTLVSEGDLQANTQVGFGDTLTLTGIVSDDLTVDVYGTLITSDLTVNGVVNAYAGSDITINGTVIVAKQFNMYDSDLELAGTITVRNDTDGGAQFVLNGTSTVTVLENGTFNVNKGTSNTAQKNPNFLEVGGSATFTVEGTLNITGTLNGAVQDKGTVTFNGTAGSEAKIVIYDGVTLNITSVTNSLIVSDTKDIVLDYAGVKTIDDKLISVGNSVTLKDVRGVTITESVVDATYENPANTERVRVYTAHMTVTGTVSKVTTASTGSITINGACSAIADTVIDSDETVTGTMTVGDMSFGRNLEITFNGVVDITGTLNANVTAGSNDEGITLTNNATSLTVSGTMVLGEGVNTINTAGLNAAYYMVTASGESTGTTETRYYTNFANAIAAIGDADDDMVLIYGNVKVSADAEIADGMTVQIQSAGKLTIDVEAQLTVADGGVLDVSAGNATNKTVAVEGVLVITNNGTGLTGNANAIDYDVLKTLGSTDTYSSLTYALANAQAGETITLSKEVTLKTNTTIPEGVTLQTGRNSVTINEKVTLTVNGTFAVQNGGSVTLKGTGDKKADIIVNGVMSVAGATSVDSMANTYGVSGAYYIQRNVGYITNVTYAAENVDDGTITLMGNVSIGDVTFTERQNGNLEIIVKNLDNTSEGVTTVNAGTITLVGATFQIQSGTATATVAAAANGSTASIDLDKAGTLTGKSIVIASDVDSTVDGDVDVLYLNGYIQTGSVTIASGTVTVPEYSAYTYDLVLNSNDNQADGEGSIAVASGATLDFEESTETWIQVIDEKTDATVMTVNGTVDLAGTLYFTSPVVVAGTLNVNDNGALRVQGSGSLTVTGTVAVTEAEDETASFTVETVLIVGEKPTTLGAAGAITGAVEIDGTGYLKAYPGADLSAAKINWNDGTEESDAVDTVFNINGTVYMTIYAAADNAVTIQTVLDAEEFELVGYDVGLKGDSLSAAQKILYLDTNWFTADTMLANQKVASGSHIGTEANASIYAAVEASYVKGTISEGTGLDLYIDNVRYSYENFVNGLQVGTHTVSFEVTAGYDGSNAKITFNGQTVENGGTITIEAGATSFTLVANGAVPATSVSGGSTSGGDDGMGLTDYLLIILVVLIVIMAIMVAMRLMRS